MRSFEFAYFLLSVIAVHLTLLVFFFNDTLFAFGGRWVVYLGFAAALVGVLIPFFLQVETVYKWLNLVPGLAFITGWGSWVWLHIIDEQGPVINIWGVFGPALGVLATIIFYIAVLIAVFLAKRNSNPV